MALNIGKFLLFSILFLLVWTFGTPLMGLSGGFYIALAFTLLVVLGIDHLGWAKVIPVPLNKQFRMYAIYGLIAFVVVGGGYWTMITGALTGAPRAAITAPGIPVTPSACADLVTAELKGKAVTLMVNAWDQESDTPMSSPVDLNVWYYANGVTGQHYVTNDTDSSVKEISGFAVGDVLYAYSGSTSYYGEPVEGLCLDGQRENVNIDAHAIATEANMQTVMYDDTGSAALSAGSGGVDYYVTMGANEDKAVFSKLKVNVANKAYHFGGWATFKFYNVTGVTPQNEEGVYTKVGTPAHLESVKVNYNTTTTTGITGSYALYAIDVPILMSQWDNIKEQFKLETGTNDPVSSDGSAAKLDALEFNGFAIISKDICYDRGASGGIDFSIATVNTAETDKCLDETETSPTGLQIGAVVSVR